MGISLALKSKMKVGLLCTGEQFYRSCLKEGFGTAVRLRFLFQSLVQRYNIPEEPTVWRWEKNGGGGGGEDTNIHGCLF